MTTKACRITSYNVCYTKLLRPITNVDNIQRHIRKNPGDPRRATLDAVAEVLPPVIMSTSYNFV